MPFETMQEVSHPGSPEKDWNNSILQKEQLLTGNTNDAQKRAADQKALTDKGVIPELEFEDSSAPTSFSCSIQEVHEEAQGKNWAAPGKDGSTGQRNDQSGTSVQDNGGGGKSSTGQNNDAGGKSSTGQNNDAGGKSSTAQNNDAANAAAGQKNADGKSDQKWNDDKEKDGDNASGDDADGSRRRHRGLFSRIDGNHNNQVTAKEWVDKFDKIAGEDQKANEKDFYKAFGKNEHTERFFKAANSNGDKDVSMTEWMRYFNKLEGKDDNFTVGRRELRRNLREQGRDGGGDNGGGDGGDNGGGDGGDNGTENFVHKPDLSKYESQEHMEYLARLAAHEQQLNGSTQPNGPQGTIFLQTMLDAAAGGKLNGQSDIFLKGDTPEQTAQRRQWFFDAMRDSMNPETGKIDGRVLSQSIVDTFYDATGKDISGSINKAEHLSAQTSNEALSVAGPGQPEDPDFIDKMSKSSGWSKEEIAWDLLWGHAQVFSQDGKLTDDGVRSFLGDALSGKDDRTSGLIKMFPEIENSAREIMKSDHPAELLNELMLASQARQFGVPIDGVSAIGDNDNDNGEHEYMLNASEQSGGQKPSIFDRFFNDIQRAADSGNKNFVNQALDNFGNKFSSFANNLLKSRGANEEGGEQQAANQQQQRQCPFMALKDKFGGAK